MVLEVAGVCRQQRGDWAGALEAFEASARGGRLDRPLLRRASILLERGRLEEAEAELERAMAIYDRRPWAWTLRARIALERGDREAAATLRNRALSLVEGYASSPPATSYECWDHAGLRQALELATRLDPADPEAWHRLARFLVDPSAHQVPWDSPAAFEAATRAADLTGHSDAEVLATLAEAQFVDGRRGEAAATIRRALEIAAEPEVRAALVVALARYES